MTNEQINIAIAEELGKTVDWHDGIPYWLGMWSSVGEGNELFAEFKPTSDLNAMHEAEKVLTHGTAKQIIHATNAYMNYLARILGCDGESLFQFTHATARQRAEAFLRTIGKWGQA
jgi:hypothetical protein